MKTMRWLVAGVAACVLVVGSVMLSLRWDQLTTWPAKKAALLASLKDPESAKFISVADGRMGTLCGEVNAKNSYGAYVGFRRFVSKVDGYLIEGGAPRTFNEYFERELDRFAEDRRTAGMSAEEVFAGLWTKYCVPY